MIVHPGPKNVGPPSEREREVLDKAKTLYSTSDLSPVRVATEADQDAVEALARLMHAEVGLFTIAEEKLRATIEQGIRHKLIGLVGDGEPAGVMCLAVSSMWFTHDFQLVDMFFFVHPEHRRSNYARSLVEWAKHVSDAVGVPITIGVFNTTRTEAKARMMGRHLEYSGSTFMHNRGLAVAAPDSGEAR